MPRLSSRGHEGWHLLRCPELRGCIEARHAEYFEHHEPLSSTKFQPWRLGENQKVVAKITEGDLISRINFRLSDGRSITQFHIPISTRLHRYAMRTVDGLRHAQNNYRTPNDLWWAETRLQLEEVYREAWVACRGELPILPLWDSETGELVSFSIYISDDNRDDMEALGKAVGTPMEIDVKHLDAPSNDWICDL